MVMPLRTKHIFSLNGSEMLKCLECFLHKHDAHDEHLIYPLWTECQHSVVEDDDDYG